MVEVYTVYISGSNRTLNSLMKSEEREAKSKDEADTLSKRVGKTPDRTRTGDLALSRARSIHLSYGGLQLWGWRGLKPPQGKDSAFPTAEARLRQDERCCPDRGLAYASRILQ